MCQLRNTLVVQRYCSPVNFFRDLTFCELSGAQITHCIRWVHDYKTTLLDFSRRISKLIKVENQVTFMTYTSYITKKQFKMQLFNVRSNFF